MPTESENTSIVNFSLDESSRIEVTRWLTEPSGSKQLRRDERKRHVRFGANLQYDTRGGGLGVIYGFRTSLYIRAHTMVVARSEGLEVGEKMASDGILRRGETGGGGVLVDTGLGDIIGSLRAEKEAITANHGIGGECGTLCSSSNSESGRETEGKERAHQP
jgi:hypothetical protein